MPMQAAFSDTAPATPDAHSTEEFTCATGLPRLDCAKFNSIGPVLDIERGTHHVTRSLRKPGKAHCQAKGSSPAQQVSLHFKPTKRPSPLSAPPHSGPAASNTEHAQMTARADFRCSRTSLSAVPELRSWQHCRADLDRAPHRDGGSGRQCCRPSTQQA